MKTSIGKLKQIEQELSFEKGSFSLFGLFLREDAPDRWDLLIGAPWAEQDKQAALSEIAQKLQSSLPSQDLLRLSRIVILDRESPALQAMHKLIHIEHGDAEIKDSEVLGIPIKQGYVITSQRLDMEATRT